MPKPKKSEEHLKPFIIVRAENTVEFNKAVNQYIKKKYQPVGHAQIINNCNKRDKYAIAMHFGPGDIEAYALIDNHSYDYVEVNANILIADGWDFYGGLQVFPPIMNPNAKSIANTIQPAVAQEMVRYS